jgi:carboxypeptidase PM20D1
MIKRIIYIFIGIIIVLAAIVSVRALLSKPAPMAPIEQAQGLNIDLNVAAENLAKAVQFKTISTHDNNQQYADSFKGLHGLLREKYADVFSKLEVKEFAPFGLLLKWKGKNSNTMPIMLMAHQDVVPIDEGTEHLWDHPPFSGIIDKGVVWGRGSMDDKGSLISILEAVSHLIKENYAPDRDIYLFFSDKEEILGETADNVAQYFKENNIRLEVVFDEGGFILAEAFSPQVPEPVAAIGLSEKGYLDLELSTKSKGGHSSTPPTHSAIGILSKAISELEDNQLTGHLTGLQREFFETLARHMQFKDKLVLTNIWLFEPLILHQAITDRILNAFVRTTTAVSVFNAGIQSNVMPAEATAIANFRIATGETVESTIKHVIDTINNPLVSLKPLKSVDPSPISSKETKAYEAISNNVKALFPKQLPIISPYVTIGVTDSRHFAGVSDNQYRFLPCLVTNSELDGFHGTNERMSVDNIGKMIQFYVMLIKEFK